MRNQRQLASLVTALLLVALICGCTSEPIISRKGVSRAAVGEIGIEALLAMAAAGGGSPSSNMHIGNIDLSDTLYVGGIIPVKPSWVERDYRVDNGTRLFVDGRKRGFLPRVLKVAKPGPHVVRLEIPAFQPYELTISKTIRLRVGQNEIEAWAPVIVDCLTGEIFTASESSSFNPDRNSGTRRKTDIAEKAGTQPLLIVTTTDTRHRGWRKIGQMKVALRAGM